MSFWLVLLIAAHIIQAYFWLWSYRKLPANYEKHGRSSSVPLPGVSVVIAVKNEANNLIRLLPAILSQEYPSFEVIVIDDHSTDDSGSILQAFAQKYPQLVPLSAKEGHGKKKALSLGVTKAKHPWILSTDADCLPDSKVWITNIIRQHEHADIILGYGPYQYTPGFLNSLIQYETWYIAMQYMSAALQKRAYMGVGRNLCFRKRAWQDVRGYTAHSHLKSGDDDLFVSALAEKRVLIETAPKSWTSSKPASSLSKLWEQKRRHLTTATAYSKKNQVLLSLNFLSAFLVYVLTGIHCYQGAYYTFILLLFRWVYLFAISRKWMERLGVLRLWLTVPFWDFALIVYYSAHGVCFWRQKKDW